MVLGGLVSTGGNRIGLGLRDALLSVCMADVVGGDIVGADIVGDDTVGDGVASGIVSPAFWLAVRSPADWPVPVSEVADAVVERLEEPDPGAAAQADSNRAVNNNGTGIILLMGSPSVFFRTTGTCHQESPA